MNLAHRTCPALVMDEIAHVFDRTDHGHLEPINFGKGVSSFNPFEHVSVHLTAPHLGRHIGYGDINGLNELRRSISLHYRKTFDYDLAPERICITDGASGALTIAMALLLDAGSELILPESCYPAYRAMAQIFDARCRAAPMRAGHLVDVERLPANINRRTRAIMINSPSNPQGAVLRADEIEALTRLGVPVIFDEVYQSLPLGETPLPSAIHHSDRHLIVGSLSKSLAIAGFRVGYLIVPPAMVQQMTNVKAVLNMCTSLPSQILAVQLLRHWDELVARHCALLQHNWTHFQQTALSLGLTLRSDPQAGFFALVDVGGGRRNSRRIALDLARDHALGSAPGIDFQERDHAFLRLNFACPEHQIEPGLTRLAEYLERAPTAASIALTRLSGRIGKARSRLGVPFPI